MFLEVARSLMWFTNQPELNFFGPLGAVARHDHAPKYVCALERRVEHLEVLRSSRNKNARHEPQWERGKKGWYGTPDFAVPGMTRGREKKLFEDNQWEGKSRTETVLELQL